ncbi:MAG: hypothetical protein ACREDF_06130, partial [Thermoplasmata archaeon]
MSHGIDARHALLIDYEDGKTGLGGAVCLPDVEVAVEAPDQNLEIVVAIEIGERGGGREPVIETVRRVFDGGGRKDGVARDGKAGPARAVVLENV